MPKYWKMCERRGILFERRDFEDERGGNAGIVMGKMWCLSDL
jgi:hypothetical protein